MASDGREKYRWSLKKLPHSKPQRIPTDTFLRAKSNTVKNNQAHQDKGIMSERQQKQSLGSRLSFRAYKVYYRRATWTTSNDTKT